MKNEMNHIQRAALRVALLLGLALSVAFPATAQEDNAAHAPKVTAEDPARIMGLLVSAGHEARLATTVYGDPVIRAQYAEIPFNVRFYGCRDGVECLSVQFIAGFATTDATLEAANEWNTAMRYARMHVLDDGTSYLAFDLNLDAGGISEDSFGSNLRLWEQMIDRYLARIGW